MEERKAENDSYFQIILIEIIYFLLNTVYPPNNVVTPSKSKIGLPVANMLWEEVALVVMFCAA